MRSARPTVGFLTTEIADFTSTRVWAGMLDAAQEQDVNLICYVGGRLRANDGAPSPGVVLYELASPEHLDGLVSWASSITARLDHDQVTQFHQRYRSLPLVTVGVAVGDTPWVSIDGYRGMYDLVVHLIQVHGYRRLAFMRGSQAMPIAEMRYQAFLDALKQEGLSADPNLVVPAVNWDKLTGASAVASLFDERKLTPQRDVQAIVIPSDILALGALEALRARGLRVPEDVAIVGVNDSDEGRAATPSLTSVALPFHAQSAQAVQSVLDLLQGRPVSQHNVLPARPVVRQSCGCVDPAIAQIQLTPLSASGATSTDLRDCEPEILREITRPLNGSDLTIRQAGSLLRSFIAEIEAHADGAFMQCLGEVLRQMGTDARGISTWHQVMAVLRRQVLPHLDGAVLARAEALWQQAQIAIGQAAQRAQMYQAVQAHQLAQALHQIGAALLATFDLQELMGVLARDLPRLGIPSCFLALYQDSNEPAAWARLMLAYDHTGPIELEPGGRRFPSRQLLPEEMWPQDRRASFVVEPLHFQRQPLGYVIFEIGPRNGALYATLQAQISSALQGAQLVQRVRERSSELARQQYILDTFMENVPDYIYFKDLDGRITRANRAHALRLGLSDPAQEIGHTDFDFFPRELARVKYEQEQAILRSGQPLLNLEEANDRGDWVLTTKMPLRDEHGRIIGTFGISREITDLVKARQAAEAASRALAKLNADKDKFFSIISHDLRGPFSTMLGGIELLADGIEALDQQDLHELIQSIYRRAKLTYSLLENLLTWSRLQRDGGIEYRPSPIDLRDLVQEMLAVLEPVAAQKEIGLSNTIPSDTWVHADRNMLETVVRNLAANAIKFTPRGGQVTWGARRDNTGEPPGLVVAWVKDTGVGMSQADLSELLRLDVHHSTAGTNNERGTGLGLIICREMVERNGGQLWVQSELGKGTVVEFTVPRLPRSNTGG